MNYKIVYFFLIVLIIASSCVQKTNSSIPVKKINVGVFNGNGASPICVIETIEALKIDSGIHSEELSSEQIMRGGLDNLDVLIFPGGSGSTEFNDLGLQAVEKVREFAEQPGKGIVGICAGAYLLCSTPDYPSLKILPVHSIREYYDRGRGLISFSTNEQGNKIFPELQNMNEAFLQYYDGPMYINIDSSKFNILATVNTDLATKNGYPRGVSIGKPAFGTARYGEGRIIITIGHPEATSGMRWMVPRMARWAANQKLISYNEELVRPEEYSEEVLFYPETIELEKKLFWKLSSDDETQIIAALDSLGLLYSRPSIRWSIGLLRHTSPQVRKAAGEYLLETEYTYAIPDIAAAYYMEPDPVLKKELKNITEKLLAIIHQK
jgi:glutamine amidotransferase-like uncharacterized protein